MDATAINRIRERIERFLAEDHAEHLGHLRDSVRRMRGLPDARFGRKRMRTTAGLAGLIDSVIPVMHVARMRRGAPKPLEMLRYRCWELGLETGIEVDEHHDFESVLYRWAQRPGAKDLYGELPDADELAEAVVQRLRPSRFWKLVLGFVPIVGPIAAYRLDVALALRFHDLATRYFRDLKSAGIRPLPEDFAIPSPPRKRSDRKKDGSPDSMRRTVERYLAEHRSEEHLRHVRGMAQIGATARSARWIAGSSGLFTNLIPIRHLQSRFRDLDTNMLLTMLQAIWWKAATNAGRDDDTGDDFERVLSLWTGGAQDDEATSREELVVAVAAKLQAACLWKLAFGFLPLIGAIMGLMIDGSMAARIYRLAHRYYEQREPLAPIAR